MSREPRAVRTLTLWCPDWPVVAAMLVDEVPLGRPAAVLRANRVVSASVSARAAGVRRGMRRREAQARCPFIEIVADDPGRDARAFEPVVAAVEVFTPLVEIVRPGLLRFATRGPARYFGGDEALAARVSAEVAGVLGCLSSGGVSSGTNAGGLLARNLSSESTKSSPESSVSAEISVAAEIPVARIGIADGPFAAAVAARVPNPSGSAEPVHIVATGQSPAFLSPLPVSALAGAHPDQGAPGRGRIGLSRRGAAATELDALRDMAELMVRLGIRTLGQLVALPPTDALARFGVVGARAQQLAAGLDPGAPRARVPPPDLLVAAELDPPVDRVDVAAFVARGLAEELHERLAREGLACTCIRIEARFEDGTELVRRWRHERAGAAGGLTPTGLADRVRWQLDGWLLARQRQIQTVRRGRGSKNIESAEPDDMPGSAITMVRLVPDEVVPDDGRQLGLWGTASAGDERAARAFARVQGLLGPEAVCTVVPAGGRHPGSLVTFVPWGDRRERPPSVDAPWPGRVPSPLPTVVHDPLVLVAVDGPSGEQVSVSGRSLPSEAPTLLRVGSWTRTITAWAGPWPVDERWWDLHEHRRRARFQLRTDDGSAHLVVLEAGSWWLEASYE